MTRLKSLSPWWIWPAINVTLLVAALIWGAYVYEIVSPVLFGGATGFALSMISSERRRARYRRRMDEITSRLPKTIHNLEVNEEENTRTLAVTLQNGDMLTTTLPLDYNPAQDNGELLMRSVLNDEEYARLAPFLHLGVVDEDDG